MGNEPKLICKLVCNHSASDAFTEGDTYELYLIDAFYFIAGNRNEYVKAVRSCYHAGRWLDDSRNSTFTEAEQ